MNGYEDSRGRVVLDVVRHARMFMEPVFVPKHDTAAEDDGWLMSYVYDAKSESGDVVMLEAADLASGHVAPIHLSRRVPFGFHGNWVPSSE
jgi:carotenoid cleavage dioxygenase